MGYRTLARSNHTAREIDRERCGQVALRVLHSVTAEALKLKLERIWVFTPWHFC